MKIPKKYYLYNLDIPKIKLPELFKCPICNHPLYIKPYYSIKDKNISIVGHPLIVCENQVKCKSPWRNDDVSWHCWIDYGKRYCIDENNYAHNHPSEEDRIKWLKKYIPIMRKEYMWYYLKLIELDKMYKGVM